MQTDYSQAMDVGVPGQAYYGNQNQVEPGVSGESSAVIPFGVAVAYGGTSDDGVILPASSGAKIKGLAQFSQNYSSGQLDADGHIKPKAPVNVAVRGWCWVKVEEAVVPGDRAYVRYAGSGQKGAWRKSNVVGETIGVTNQARFESTAAANGLARLAFDFITPP